MSLSEKEMKREFEADCSQKAHDEAYNEVMDSIGIIQQDRENDYGDAKTSHANIAKFWNAYLERKNYRAGRDDLDATDVAVMLSIMKVSRLAFKRKHDSFLDFASYADFALKFEESGK